MVKIISFVLVSAAGLFSVFCSVKDYNWFFEHRKARFFAKIFGRNGARIFYALLGTSLFIAGLIGALTSLA